MNAGVDNAIRWTASAPWRNVWIEPEMIIDVIGGSTDSPAFTPWEGELAAGSSTSGWVNVTPSAGVDQLSVSVTLNAVAFYDHSSSKRPDRQTESIPLELNIQVHFRVFTASPSLIVLGEGNESSTKLINIGSANLTKINSTTQRGAVRFTDVFDANGSLTEVQFDGSLQAGWSVVVEYIGPAPASNGTHISFTAETESGTIVEAALAVIPEPKQASLPEPPISGKVAILYGWLGLGALGLIMVQGFSKRALDRLYKERYKEARTTGTTWDAEMPAERASYWWWLHFSLLGGIMAFTAIHIIGFGVSDTMPPISFEIWLGIIGILLISVAGYSGLYPKLSKKYIPWLSFRKGHLVLSIIGLIFVTWHSIILM